MDIETQLMEQMIGHSIPFEKSDEDGSPVYFQLAKAIQRQIEKGTPASGALIPSERKIALHTNLSVATVRKALEMLVNRGFLTRLQGKGTYVTGTAQRRHKIRYYPLVNDFYSDAPNWDIKILGLKRIDGQPSINRLLKIRETEELYQLERILFYQDVPLVTCVSYLPRHMFKGLEAHDLRNSTLYLFLEDKFGIATISHRELLSAVLADEEVAGYLKVDAGHPVLKIEKLVFTHQEKPYEYRISYCRTDESRIRRVL